MRRLAPLTLLALLALLAVLPAAAPAKINVAVGIGDQSSGMFGNPNFQALKVKKVRYFMRWNAADDPAQLAEADRYVAAARSAGARVLLHISTDRYVRPKDSTPANPAARLPSVAEYRAKVGALVRRYHSQGVRDWGVWNEANHDTQPTYRSPKRAAQFFLAMRSMCRGCTIVALDVLDQAGVERYIKRFYSALGRRRSQAKIVGIHNYSDTNRRSRRGRGTRSIIATTKRSNRRAQFWLTETGGVVQLGTSFRCDPNRPAAAEKRAAGALRNMFALTKRFRRDVKRLYIYNFSGTNCSTRFDAGLMRDLAGTIRRPGYTVVRNAMRQYRR